MVEPSDRQAFPRVDDLLTQGRLLAHEHADQMRVFSFGRSRRGEDLLALRLGDGPQHALVYGFPQPDEPLGGVATLHLARLLLQKDDLCQLYTWTLVPCVDPDGARLNEGWFSVSSDLASYIWGHYRPSEGEQVEWSFPSSDPAWRWDHPLPETQALQALLEEVQPDFLFPLHNALLGGAYAFLSREAKPFAPMLPPFWRAQGLPTHLGEPELPFAPVLAPGVYGLPSLEEIAAALAANGVLDPVDLLQCGAPAYLYARRFGQTLTMVPELPLFVVPGIGDTRPAECSRRQVLNEALQGDRDAFSAWSSLYDRAAPFLSHDSPYRRVVESHQRSAPPLMEAAGHWLRTDSTLDRPATIAEVVDCQCISPYMHLLPLGILWQALAVEAGLDTPSLELLALQEQVLVYLETRVADTLARLPVRPVPRLLLVEVIGEMVCATARNAWRTNAI